MNYPSFFTTDIKAFWNCLWHLINGHSSSQSDKEIKNIILLKTGKNLHIQDKVNGIRLQAILCNYYLAFFKETFGLFHKLKYLGPRFLSAFHLRFHWLNGLPLILRFSFTANSWAIHVLPLLGWRVLIPNT